jgi:hypothetical protein
LIAAFAIFRAAKQKPMKNSLTLLFGLLPLTALHAEEGFVSLYNGKDLSGWTVVNGDGKFAAEGECIVGSGKDVKSNTFLRSDKTYKNFDFHFEMKFDDLSGNSGMMFRALQKPGNDGRVHGYQCEHDNGKARAWTAGLYDEARRGWLYPDKSDKEKQAEFTKTGQQLIKWDDWNKIRILCEDKHIQIWLNGEKRVDYTDTAPEFTAEGFFALQVHGGKSCNVRWRHLEIKTL